MIIKFLKFNITYIEFFSKAAHSSGINVYSAKNLWKNYRKSMNIEKRHFKIKVQ